MQNVPPNITPPPRPSNRLSVPSPGVTRSGSVDDSQASKRPRSSIQNFINNVCRFFRRMLGFRGPTAPVAPTNNSTQTNAVLNNSEISTVTSVPTKTLGQVLGTVSAKLPKGVQGDDISQIIDQLSQKLTQIFLQH